MNRIIIDGDQARLYGTPKAIPQGQSQFSQVQFSFSEEWDNLRKIAQFEQKGNPYNVEVSDDRCFCPSELVKGVVNVRVKGYPVDNTSAVIATANEVVLPVSAGFQSGGIPSVPPTPDLYQKLIGEFSDKVQSDWNQNDPTAKDYIKNRTHYVSTEQKVIVPEQEVTTAVQNNFNIAILNGVDFDTFKTLFNSEDNTTFDVVFDGASYPCKWLEQNGVRIPGFGNLAITDSSLTDTGEPFCTSLGKGSGARDILAIACKVAGTHTVSVSYPQDVVHTIDPKYIKDMYHAESQEVMVGTSMNGWWDVTNGGTNPVIPKMLVVNAVYENLVPSKVEGIDYYYAVGDYTFQFHASERESYRYLSITPEFEGNYDQIAFFGIREDITPIPDKYISDQIPRKNDITTPMQSDWNETDDSSMAYIKNKPGIIKYVEVISVGASSSVVDLGPFSPISLIFTQKIGERIPLMRAYCAGTYSNIISSKTGQALTAAECPYGCMFLVKEFSNRIYCINPL